MKSRFSVLSVACFILVELSTAPTSLGDLVTFDDIVANTPSHETNVPSLYHGLSWSNFYIQSPTIFTDGYYYGTVSPSNAAFNGAAEPAEIDAIGTNFNFLSAYLTGAFNSNLNIEIQGFSGGNLLYDTTVVASATSPTLFTFDYLDVDRLYFNSFGGQDAGFHTGGGEQLVMDNFTFDFVPEPSAFLLTAAGALMLWSVVKRKRVT